MEPGNGSFHYQLGRIYSLLGQPVESRKEMQLAARLIKNYNQQQVRELSADESIKHPAYASDVPR